MTKVVVNGYNLFVVRYVGQVSVIDQSTLGQERVVVDWETAARYMETSVHTQWTVAHVCMCAPREKVTKECRSMPACPEQESCVRHRWIEDGCMWMEIDIVSRSPTVLGFTKEVVDSRVESDAFPYTTNVGICIRERGDIGAGIGALVLQRRTKQELFYTAVLVSISPL